MEFASWGGFLADEDLAKVRVHWVEPLGARFGNYRLWELPPPGQGLRPSRY